MYLSIASYVVNDHTIVRGATAEAHVLPALSKLFLASTPQAAMKAKRAGISSGKATAAKREVLVEAADGMSTASGLSR